MIHERPLIGLPEAARLYPGARGAEHICTTTLTRWIQEGVHATNGTLVKLEAIRAGYRWLTTYQALERFSAALTNPESTTNNEGE